MSEIYWSTVVQKLFTAAEIKGLAENPQIFFIIYPNYIASILSKYTESNHFKKTQNLLCMAIDGDTWRSMKINVH